MWFWISTKYIPNFLTLPSSSQEGEHISVRQNLQTQEGDQNVSQNQKLCSISPCEENSNFNDQTLYLESAKANQQHDQTHDKSLLTIPDDNLWHQY